jgi:hypothetical protein
MRSDRTVVCIAIALAVVCAVAVWLFGVGGAR